MSVNLNQPAKAIITDLIYELYGVTVPDVASWGPPVKYPPIFEDVYQRDTAVMIAIPSIITPKPLITGTVTIRYSRYSLGALNPEESASITMESTTFTTEDLLPQINYSYGTQLTLDDVINTHYTDVTDSITITANPLSLAWKGFLTLAIEVESDGEVIIIIPPPEHESTGEEESTGEVESTHIPEST